MTRLDPAAASTAQLAAAVAIDLRHQDQYVKELLAVLSACLH